MRSHNYARMAKMYRIEIEDQLSEKFLAVLGDYREQIIDDHYYLEGDFEDQAELIGLIQKLFSLHIDIISVVPVE